MFGENRLFTRGSAVAAGMGLLDKLRSAFSDKPRLEDELADLAGACEALVTRMQRHAELCSYPAIAQGVREIAAQEAVHEKTLRSILAARGRWPRPPESTGHEGSSNWERLSLDLAALLLFAQQLHRHAIRCEGDDPALAEQLFEISREAAESETRLRRLAAMCDPQALD